MRARLTLASVLLTVFAIAVAASAAPSLPITKPPAVPVPSFTGPEYDPHAMQGQWFSRLSGPGALPTPQDIPENRTHEFYDNVLADGGGFTRHLSIQGVAQNIQYGFGGPGIGNIVSFDIFATITNDLPGVGPWMDGDNAHNEVLQFPEQYEGPLLGTKLTAEFVRALNGPLPAQMGSPYFDIQPNIVATNHDQLAWYCWTPSATGPDGFPPLIGQQPGRIFVPTWDFGDILPGQSAVRLLSFTVDGGGLAPGDLRYAALQAQGKDVFYNRTTDLKIGDWMDMLLVDGGTPYAIGAPEGWPDGRSGNVSVFHNVVPEPGSLLLCLSGALGLALVLRRRFRR